MKRRSWRSKGPPGVIRKSHAEVPGGMVSVDQLVSKQPGLIPRIDGKHTLERVTGATVYADNYSGFCYSHLQSSLDTDQTIQSKLSFESLVHNMGVKIQAYRADNGRFIEKGYREAVTACKQTIDYCGAGAHNQNGIIERTIGLMTNDSRTLLLGAMRRWPDMISTLLWPYAWKEVERRNNYFSYNRHGVHPVQSFANVSYPPRLRDWHTWGCPVFVLEDKAREHMNPKWDPKARVGIYLGHSPIHAGSVALVLNPRTLHVSPQFHIVVLLI